MEKEIVVVMRNNLGIVTMTLCGVKLNTILGGRDNFFIRPSRKHQYALKYRAPQNIQKIQRLLGVASSPSHLNQFEEN